MDSFSISINGVRKRSKRMTECLKITAPDRVYEQRCISAIERKNPISLLECIKQVRNINNFDINLVLECYDVLSRVGNTSQINSAVSTIVNEAEVKVRDASALNNLLKQRLGRLTHKNATKINNKLDSAFDAVGNSLAQMQSKFQNPSVINSTTEPSEAQTEAAINGYKRMIDESVKLIHYDRIIENYGSISKRFNIDRLFFENTTINGVEDTVNELCKLIDTYNMDIGTKYNTVIESAWYALNTNHIDHDMVSVVEAATDYFIQKENGLYICRSILEGSVVVNKDTKSKIIYITKDDPKEKEKIDDSVQEALYSYIDDIKSLTENGEQRAEKNSSNHNNVHGYLIEEAEPRKDFQQIFNDFKKNNSESNIVSGLSSLVRNLYSTNVDNIVSGTPNLLSYIRRILILGSGAINPILMIVGLIANEFIEIHMERKDIDEMIRAFKNEKNIAGGKMNSTDSPEEKERLEAYIKELNKAIDKIEAYQITILSDKEIENKYNNYPSTDDFKREVDPSMSDDDLDKMINGLNDDDFDMSFGEVNVYQFIPLIASLCESLINESELSHDYDNTKMISIMSDDDIKNYAVFSTMFPNCIDPDNLYTSISMYYDDITREGSNVQFESFVDKYHKISACKDALKIIENAEGPTTSIDIYENCCNIYRCILGMKAIREFDDCLNSKGSYVLEASFANKLKLAGENLRRSIVKMGDKEREISKSVDIGLNNIIKNAEKAITNDNRAAVINGSILPSASKVIKLAITAGVAYLIQPALAVITVLGYIGVSKGLQAKERKRIIDEIDIELKMCSKYIEVAESKNNMKNLKQLYTIQRELERQRQRLKYNMNAKGVVLVEPTSNGGY